MRNRLNLAAMVLAALVAPVRTAQAHSLDTKSTHISFAKDELARMSLRAGLNQPLIQVGDEFWVVLKTTPGPGTITGVGGYQTFYVPQGAQIVDVAYVMPNAADPRGFVAIPMKGQSPIAIGAGPVGAKAAVGLTGYSYPTPNVLGINEAPVTAGGISRGTIAGVYADTGIFYSTDPRTVFNSYGAAASGGSAPMTNNSGDTVGEWDAVNVADSTTLGVMTLWDSYQLRAFGRKDVAPIIDLADGRGNAPWGMASAVAGPQSGYQWSFNYLNYSNTVGSVSQKVQAGIEVGPWNRIKYPGSQASKDQAGLNSSTLGYTGVDASNLGTAVSSGNPLPNTVTAVRFAIGQLELGRPEYSAVKVRILGPTTAECYQMYADAFGGDAGGTAIGKDHIWRYFDPTVVSLKTCAFLQKVVKDPLLAPGGTTSFAINFANTGDVALPNVVLTDVLPSGLTYLSSAPAASVSGSTLTWSLGTVNPGQMVSLTVNVKATTTGTLVNSVTATSDGNFVANAQDSVEVGKRALLREVKTVTPSTVSPGQSVTYTMTVFNDGTGPNGVPLVVTDYLPSGFTYASFVSATLNGAVITPTINTSNPNRPVFTVGSAIQPGKTLVIKFTALVGPSTPNGTYNNQVELNFEGKQIPPIPEAPVTVGGGQLGDTVFRDWNGNGTQDAGEEGLPGVAVTLTYFGANGVAGGGDDVVTTTSTDANGNYLFTGLSPGNYQVAVPSPGTGGVPAGYTLTADPDGAAATTIFAKTLALNEIYLGADWGYKPGGAGSIGDTVFSDVNNNRHEDANDPGIPNVTVTLYEDSNGNGRVDVGDLPIATTITADGTTTDVNGDPIPAGFYQFGGLDPALNYVVDVDGSDPDIAAFFGHTYQASTPDQVVVNGIPSDGAGGFAFTTADFGFFGIEPATLGDLVYLDVDKNGSFNAGDLPLSNVTVQLYIDENGDGIANEAVFATTTTDLNGNYLFSNLGPANYIVKVLGSDPDLPAGAVSMVAQFSQTLSPGEIVLTADFPYVRTLDKVVDKASETDNGILTYTLSPFYPGKSPLSSVQVVDAVPAGTTYNGNASPAPASAPAIGGSGNVVWNLGSTVAPADGTGTNPGYIPTAITRSTTAEVDDSYIQEDSGGNDWFGGANTILTDPESGKRKVALMKFTLPALNPADVVDRAVIRVMITGARTNTSVTMRRLTTNWSEGTGTTNGVTWNDPNGTGTTGTWSAGAFSAADYDPTVSYGSYSAPFVNGQTLEFDVTDLVRAWRAGTSPNNGIALIASGTDIGDLTFRSSDGSAANTPGPRLIIGYSQVGSGTFTVGDNFGTVGYNNNDGTRQWAGDWIEVGDGGAPNGGSLLITGGHLRVKDGAAVSIYRSANLSGATAATLTYDLFANTLDNVLDVIKLQASNNGGASWTDLRTFTLGTTGAGNHNLITALGSVTNDTRIRFIRISSSGGAKQIEVDNLLLSYTSPSGGVTATSLSADTALLSGSRNVTVSMRVASSINASVTPPTNLTVTATGTAGATKVSGPSPASGQADSNGVTFTYVYQVTSGAGTGSVRFSGVPAGPSGFTFNTGTSQSVLTTAPLTFQARVNTPAPNPGPILNTANIIANSGALSFTSPQATTATKASIGDYVWLDRDGDGVQDPGEPGIPGVTVRAYADVNMDGVPDGPAVGSAVTDVAGHYQINGLDAGNYLVIYDGTTAPSGYYPTTAPSQPVYGLTGGQQYLAADFGLQPPPANPASIGDTVWIDANNNGVVDSGEAAIANVDVKLYADWNNNGIVDSGDALIAITSTDASGLYTFTNLNAGHYVVQVDGTDPQFPDGLALVTGGSPVTTPPANGVWDVDLSAGQNLVTADFGYNWTGEIGDYVWWDSDHDGVQDGGELPIAGALVMLYADVNHNGIIDVINGDYQITTTNTDANGGYMFTTLPAGDYLVDVYEDSIAVVGEEPVPTTRNVVAKSLAAGEHYLTADFGYYQGALIVGDVFWDANRDTVIGAGETGLTPVTVTLTGTDEFGNPVSVVTTTDAEGHFSFIVPEGDYTLTYSSSDITTPRPDLGDETTPTSYTFHAEAGEDHISYFAFGVDNLGRIGDTIFADANGNGTQGPGEAGLADVTVELYQDNNNNNVVDAGDTLLDVQLTDANGEYLFVGLADGNYLVNVLRATVPAGYDSNPTAHPPTEWTSGSVAGATVTGGAAVLDRDFGYHPTAAVFTVSGNIWNDNGSGGGISGDGIKNGAEANLAGITVTLSVDADGAGPNPPQLFTVVTDASGNYILGGVPAGALVIVTVDTATLPSAAYVNTGDPDGVKNSSTSFTMPAANVTGKDFGYLEQLGSIAGTVVRGDGDGLAEPGEPVLDGVSVTLTYAGSDGILGTDDDQSFTTTTDAIGDYAFASLPPGDYAITTTVPGGYLPYADRDGINPNNISVNLPVGGNKVDQDFEYQYAPGAISGHVLVDTNHDNIGDTPLAGVTLELRDGSTNALIATTTTDAEGAYNFADVPPGSYKILETQPAGYDSVSDKDGGDLDVIGDVTLVTVSPGATNSGNDFVEIGCPDNWGEWKAQHPGETAAGNPDGDAYDNLAEFAFAISSDSGVGNAWLIQPSTSNPDLLEGVFVRPKGAPENVIYSLQYAASVGDPTVWQTLVITPEMITIVDNGDCTETVTIHDLEALTGLTGGSGVVQIKADLDEEPPSGIDHTSYTEVEGWKETALNLCCRTYNNPFLREAVFTGTVDVTDGVSGQTLHFTSSAGGVDLASLLAPGESYYLEVTSGDNEGQRFDVVSASGSSVTLATDNNLTSAAPPFNTLTGALPATLAGDSVVLRPHWTLGGLFPPGSFDASDDPELADQVQTYAEGAFTSYWLDSSSGTATWVKFGDASDQASTVFAPGRGSFVTKRQTTSSILSYGEVRANDFICPLGVGMNLVGGGYPLDQSATGAASRQMTMAAGFFGSRDFKTADSFYLWKADTNPSAGGYDSYYLLNRDTVQPAQIKWVKVGDAMLTPWDASKLLLSDSSAFIRCRNNLYDYTTPNPWTP